MVFVWHCAIAHSIWAWVVRQEPVAVLTRRLWGWGVLMWLMGVGFFAVGHFEHSIGLFPHSHCAIRVMWLSRTRPTVALLLDRMLILPTCWLYIVTMNLRTIRRLQSSGPNIRPSSSGRPLQVRPMIRS
jgi:hypothetical protein